MSTYYVTSEPMTVDEAIARCRAAGWKIDHLATKDGIPGQIAVTDGTNVMWIGGQERTGRVCLARFGQNDVSELEAGLDLWSEHDDEYHAYDQADQEGDA